MERSRANVDDGTGTPKSVPLHFSEVSGGR